MYELATKLSLSGKTKYFGVLLNGEFVQAGSKKAASLFVAQLNSQIKQQNNDKPYNPDWQTKPEYTISDASCYDSSECNQPEASCDGGDRHVRFTNECPIEVELPTEGFKYPTPLRSKEQHDSVLRKLASGIKECGEQAAQHKREAAQHKRNAEDIQAICDELIPALLNIGRHPGVSQQDKVPQQQPRERTIYQVPERYLGGSTDND